MGYRKVLEKCHHTQVIFSKCPLQKQTIAKGEIGMNSTAGHDCLPVN